MLDNRYTDMITSLMLPRQLTLPSRPPAKLNPSLSHSWSLFALLSALPSFRINHLQPLFTNTRVGGTSAFTASLLLPQSHAPRSASISSTLSQLRILPVATGCGVNK